MEGARSREKESPGDESRRGRAEGARCPPRDRSRPLPPPPPPPLPPPPPPPPPPSAPPEPVSREPPVSARRQTRAPLLPPVAKTEPQDSGARAGAPPKMAPSGQQVEVEAAGKKGQKERGAAHPLHNSFGSRSHDLYKIIETATSPECKKSVEGILEHIHQLSVVEKLYLYLKLPTGKSVEVDPLKQAVNILGGRFEIQQTITWIKTHFQEDHEVSLPKQDVYDDYLDYCNRNSMKPLSTADFGKVMKQVFPEVRPRRLGTRGNSRYCYAGLQKQMKLKTPALPDLGNCGKKDEISENSQEDDEVFMAASLLIREWAEKLLDSKFETLKDLAFCLIENKYVDNRSVAAFTLLSAMSKKPAKKGASMLLSGQGGKHRETQLQLQRKLQEKELIREQKRKLQEQQLAVSGGPGERTRGSKRAKLGPTCSDKKKVVGSEQEGQAEEREGQASQYPASSLLPPICDTLNAGGSTPGIQAAAASQEEGTSVTIATADQVIVISSDNRNGLPAQKRVAAPEVDKAFFAQCQGESTNVPESEAASVQPIQTKSGLLVVADVSSGEVWQPDKKKKSISSISSRGHHKRPSSPSLPKSCKDAAGVAPPPMDSGAQSGVQISTVITSPLAHEGCSVILPKGAVQSRSHKKGSVETLAAAKMPIPRLPQKCARKPVSNFIIVPPITPQVNVYKPKCKYKPIQPKPTPIEETAQVQTDVELTGDSRASYKNPVVRNSRKEVEVNAAAGSAAAVTEEDGSMDESSLGESKLNERRFESGSAAKAAVVNENGQSGVHLHRLAKDTLADILHEGNSQEHEEELVHYFKDPGDRNGNREGGMLSEDGNDSAISQLRMLLEKNLVKPNHGVQDVATNPAGKMKGPLHDNLVSSQIDETWFGTFPAGEPNLAACMQNSALGTRRRVSFEMPRDPQDVAATLPNHGSVPPSPNTRRRAFDFTPISPHPVPSLSETAPPPQSPDSSLAAGRCLLPSGGCGNGGGNNGGGNNAAASPFVSPRSTPVCRSRHNSGQNPRGTPYSHTSDVSRTATCGSDCGGSASTPFISPQSTPVPFARSRHSSSQGGWIIPQYAQQSRSRHSSGAAVMRGSVPHSPMTPTTPFSPQGSLEGETVHFAVPDGRSRHSSAGSVGSAPMSPHCDPDPSSSLLQAILRSKPTTTTTTLTCDPHRQRHLSAGVLPHRTSYASAWTPAEEVSTLLQSSGGAGGVVAAAAARGFPRSQSVPLQEMLQNMATASFLPTTTTSSLAAATASQLNYSHSHPSTPVISQQFTFPSGVSSVGSSYTPTPVPSEFADFGSGEGTPMNDASFSDPLVAAALTEENLGDLLNDVLAGAHDGGQADSGFGESTASNSFSQSAECIQNPFEMGESHVTLNTLNSAALDGGGGCSFAARRSLADLLEQQAPSLEELGVTLEDLRDCDAISKFVQEMESEGAGVE